MLPDPAMAADPECGDRPANATAAFGDVLQQFMGHGASPANAGEEAWAVADVGLTSAGTRRRTVVADVADVQQRDPSDDGDEADREVSVGVAALLPQAQPFRPFPAPMWALPDSHAPAPARAFVPGTTRVADEIGGPADAPEGMSAALGLAKAALATSRAVAEGRPMDEAVGPHDVPTADLTGVPTGIPTGVLTEVRAEVLTRVLTKVPAEVPMDVLTRVLTAAPAAVPLAVATTVPGEIPTQVLTKVPTGVPIQVLNSVPTEVAQADPMAPGIVAELTEPATAATPGSDTDAAPRARGDRAPAQGQAKTDARPGRGATIEHPAEREMSPLIGEDEVPGPTRVSAAMPASSHDRGNGESTRARMSPQVRPIERTAAVPVFSLTGGSRVAAPPPLTAMAAPATVDPAGEADLPRQIVQSIRLQSLAGGGEAHVRLRPEYLGELTVAVKVERGTVTASLRAETPAVRQWIEANEGSLRQSLAEVGLHLERLSVSEHAPPTESESRDRRRQPREERQAQQHHRRPRRAAEGATFEVVV